MFLTATKTRWTGCSKQREGNHTDKEIIAAMMDSISDKVPTEENEYMGEDGLMRCAVCHAATQTRVVIESLGINRVVRCICDCRKKELAEADMRSRQEETERRRRSCFAGAEMAAWRFEADDRKNAKLSDAMERYANDFNEYKRTGRGLLLHGPVGTGKTFYAACIANRLIDRGYGVLVTNFAELVNRLQNTFDGKQAIMDELDRCSLLVIDDLGAERSNDYMQEIVYNIVDRRYRVGLPLIVTTNLPMTEIKSPADIRLAGIYDRILQMCHPVEVSGLSRRRADVRESYADMNARLGL